MAKNKFLRGLWRLIQPIRYTHGSNLLRLPNLYWRYWQDWNQLLAMGGEIIFENIHPCLFDRDSNTQTGGGHYFYQDIWALNKLAEFKPIEHHDIGSRLDGFVGQATAICNIIYWDIRQPNFHLPRFQFRQGSILNLPISDRSILSLSCLNVVEHIGLGRYGDNIDPKGTEQAMKELQRVIAPGGRLFFSVPIGQKRTCFNAHRILHPLQVIDIFNELDLISFSVVNDQGIFIEKSEPPEYLSATFTTGLYCFQRSDK